MNRFSIASLVVCALLFAVPASSDDFDSCVKKQREIVAGEQMTVGEARRAVVGIFLCARPAVEEENDQEVSDLFVLLDRVPAALEQWEEEVREAESVEVDFLLDQTPMALEQWEEEVREAESAEANLRQILGRIKTQAASIKRPEKSEDTALTFRVFLLPAFEEMIEVLIDSLNERSDDLVDDE